MGFDAAFINDQKLWKPIPRYDEKGFIISNFIIFYLVSYMEGCEAQGCEAHLQLQKQMSLSVHTTIQDATSQ